MIRRDALSEYVRGSLWVLPTLSVLVALAAGSLLSEVSIGPHSPLAFQGTSDDARTMLIGIAGTMVTVIALLLGLTVVALQLSSTQYSPRLLRNFLRDRPNQIVLSVFVATFAYSAAGLYTVGVSGGNRTGAFPRLAVSGALEELVTHAAPRGFLAKQGVATVVAATLLATTGDNPGRVRKEASFAALCGASPVDASSGKQLRHRLNRGGDRQANSALWTIAMTRLAHDPRTKAYLAHCRGQNQERDHPLPQALLRPRDLQGPMSAATARQGISPASQTRSFGSGLDVGASAVTRGRFGFPRFQLEPH
jgi:predicted membrane protein DUF2254/transposase IS116/IS110/IS902 family protein